MTQDELRAQAMKMLMGAPAPKPVVEGTTASGPTAPAPVKDSRPLLEQALDNRLSNEKADDAAKAETRKKLIEGTDPGLTAKLLGSLMR